MATLKEQRTRWVIEEAGKAGLIAIETVGNWTFWTETVRNGKACRDMMWSTFNQHDAECFVLGWRAGWKRGREVEAMRKS